MKYKISANIVAKDEMYWIKESILSIVELVDEIIFIDDDSTDITLNIVEDLAKVYKNIKVFKAKDHELSNLAELKNFAKNNSKNKWIMRWDADFIAYEDIYKLFEFVMLNEDKFDGYPMKGPNLFGDINHYLNGKEHYGPEVNIFKKNKMSFKHQNNHIAYPVFDKDIIYCYLLRTRLKRDHFFVHMNSLKTIEKIAFRKKMNPYHITKKNNESYWEWIASDNKIDPKVVKHIEKNKVRDTFYNLEKFDFEKWGNHPKILTNSESCDLFKVKQFKKGFKIVAPD